MSALSRHEHRPAVGHDVLIASRARGHRMAVSALAVPLALYASALLVRLWAVAGVSYPVNEGSAYYIAVARNLVEGRGLISDALWSYATPPLIVPRPAFELWQPMASFIAAAPMAFLGPALESALVGYAVIGALLAPLTWAIARDAASAMRLDERRTATAAVGSGVLAAILGPFLFATAVPDSTAPFLVLGVACCWTMPRAAAGGAAAGLALGVLLGLAYLARLESIYLAAAYLFLVGRRWRLLVPVVAGGLAVTVPWLARNAVSFGTLFPGQAIENLFFVSNEDVFAYLERPTLARWIDQGPAEIAGNVAAALTHNLVAVLLVPAAPVALVGLLSVAYLWRHRAMRHTALGALLISGGLTYVVLSALFPVASLWGTFLHASGPLLVGLTVAAVLGMDGLVAAVRRLRGWPRANAWLGPLALIVLALPIAFLQVAPVAALAAEARDRHAAVAAALLAQPDLPPRVVSDRPVWLAEAAGVPAMALPDEPLDSVMDLAARFGAPMIVVIDGRGRYPAEFRTDAGRQCFEERLLAPVGKGGGIFVLRPDCVR